MDLELADVWLFDSMKKYSSLHMYDLEQSVTAGDWIRPQGLCVAVSDGKKHEILELSLPDRLLRNEDQAGLSKDRDFRVETGGFMEEKINKMSHLPNSRCVITSTDIDNSIRVLQVGGDDLNLICRKCTIKHTNATKQSAVFGVLSDNQVVFGNNSSNLSLADITTGTVIACLTDNNSMNNTISVILPIDTFTCISCERSTGQIYIIDSRDRKLVCSHSNRSHSDSHNIQKAAEGCNKSNCSDLNHVNISDSYWTMCMSCDQERVYQISNLGKIRFKDWRNIKHDITTTTSLSTEGDCISVTCSPCGKYLAVSGFNGNVYIYSTQDVKDGCKVEPIFTHEGHFANTSQSEMLSSVHMWHPDQSELVLSGASDGSLHAWRPVLCGVHD